MCLSPFRRFKVDPVNRGAELFDEGLNGLRVQREASFEVDLELGFGQPRPMAPPTETGNLDQSRPQGACGVASFRSFRPFRGGQGNTIGAHGRFLHGTPEFLTHRYVLYGLGL